MTSLPGLSIHRQHHQGLEIDIRDHGDLRELYFAGKYLQSSMSLADNTRLMLSYTRIMAFSLLLPSQLERILMIGVGAGSLLRFFHHYFPGCHIDAVDNSAPVLALARGWFGLPEDERIAIHCEDGASFIIKQEGIKYDLILIDAFNGKGMSETIYTEDFLAHASHALGAGGVVSANIWSGRDDYFRAVQDNFDSAFTETLSLPVPERGNVVIMAFNSEVPWNTLNSITTAELSKLSRHYGVNWKHIIKLAMKHNMSLSQRFMNLFT